MLIKFPLLLRMGEKGTKFFVQLVTLDIGMIVCAFIAETSPIGSNEWWGFFIVACVLELLIVAILYTGLGSAIKAAPAPIAKSLDTMRLFILIGWAIYPIGFLMAYSGYGEVREIFYNVADVINKVGFGLAAYWGIEALSHSTKQTA
jgi:bacteriorhodopsin